MKVREILRQRARNRKLENNDLGTSDKKNDEIRLSLQDIDYAEHVIIVVTQRYAFQGEFDSLSGDKAPVSVSSSLRKLDPILENGVIRVGGRLAESKMPEESKHPAIIPKDSLIATLIIQHIHTDMHHCGKKSDSISS